MAWYDKLFFVGLLLMGAGGLMAVIGFGALLSRPKPILSPVLSVSHGGWGTSIVVFDPKAGMATAVGVPLGEPGEILTWDAASNMYRWAKPQ